MVGGGSSLVVSGKMTMVSVWKRTEDDGGNTSKEENALAVNGVGSGRAEVAKDGEGGIKTVVGSGKIISSLEDGSGVGLVMKSLEAMMEEVVGETSTAELEAMMEEVVGETSTVELEAMMEEVVGETSTVELEAMIEVEVGETSTVELEAMIEVEVGETSTVELEAMIEVEVGETSTVELEAMIEVEVGETSTVAMIEVEVGETSTVELEAMMEEVVGESNKTELVCSGKITTIDDEVNVSTIEVVKAVVIASVDEGSGNMSMDERERVGTGDGVKTLIERVSSDEDIGMSRLFEDESTTPGLENTVLSGIGEEAEKLGVGSMLGNSTTSELLLNGISELGVVSMVGSGTSELLVRGNSDVAGSMSEVSGISRSLVMSGIVVVGSSINTVEDTSVVILCSMEVGRSAVVTISELIVGANGDSVISGVESVGVSGNRISELITGASEDVASNWVVVGV